MQIITNSTQETEKLGAVLAEKLRGGEVLLLSGDLGAGKTALVKGVAKGFGIKNEITSPTFTLLNIYEVKGEKLKIKDKKINTLVHIDTYRLKHEKELVEIGVEDYLGKNNTVCLVEWPEKITNLLKNARLKKGKVIYISLEHQREPDKRKIILKK